MARHGAVRGARAARLARGGRDARRDARSVGAGAAAAGRLPGARVIRGEATPLPFASGAFERLFTSFFYGHLQGLERDAFLAEARRVAGELVVVDSALGAAPAGAAEQWPTSSRCSYATRGERALAACGRRLEVLSLPASRGGIDETLVARQLRMPPGERLRSHDAA